MFLQFLKILVWSWCNYLHHRCRMVPKKIFLVQKIFLAQILQGIRISPSKSPPVPWDHRNFVPKIFFGTKNVFCSNFLGNQNSAIEKVLGAVGQLEFRPKNISCREKCFLLHFLREIRIMLTESPPSSILRNTWIEC